MAKNLVSRLQNRRRRKMNKHKTLWRLSIVAATLALCLMSPSPVARATDVPWDTTHIIDGSFDGALSVTTADIDGDGDLDVLGAAPDANDVAWWENNGSGGGWAHHFVDADFAGAQEAHAADMDNDGDLDVLGVGSTIISYWENNGSGGGWTERVVIGSFNNARSVYPADVDGDGDTDVLGANVANGVVWWENDRTLPDDGTPWTQRNVPTFDWAWVVSAADVDSDGDLDVLAGSDYYDQVRVYRNDGSGTAWTAHTLSGFTDPNSLHAADLDGDGDLDVVGAGTGNGTAGWWENTDGAGTSWTYRRLSGAPDRAVAVYPADVLGTFDYSAYPNVIWWENDGSPTDGWVQRRVQAGFAGAAGVCAGDLDGDGDQDVVATSNTADDVAWWENETIHRSAAFPPAGQHTIWDNPGESIHAADIDGDGDMDMLTASPGNDGIIWWENTDGAGTAWAWHTVALWTFPEAQSAYAADVDGDGDLDILGAAYDGDDIVWWENTNGVGAAWVWRTVDGDFDGAYSVHAADVDGDGDLDVLGAAYYADDITWWENTNGVGTTWSEHVVDGDFDEAKSVYTADMDGDGDLDILGAGDDGFTWWENTNGVGTSWQKRGVSGYPGVSVYAADMDGDGDTDVLGAPEIVSSPTTWWENTNGLGTTWSEHVIDNGGFNFLNSVHAADMDGDGDMDVLDAVGFTGGSGPPPFDDADVNGLYDENDITWWENTDGLGTSWSEHIVHNHLEVPKLDVYAADMDGDGDLDILGRVPGVGFVWWENLGGQFGLSTANTAPASMNAGTMDDVLRITMTHLGRPGDSDEELVTLDLLLEGCYGSGCTPVALTDVQAGELFDELRVYRDDGSGAFEVVSDTLVATVSTFSLAGGVQTVVFGDGDPNVQVVYGTPQTFFVVVDRVDTLPGTPTVNQFRITHVTESSSTAQDRSSDIPLLLEFVPNAASSLVEILGPNAVALRSFQAQSLLSGVRVLSAALLGTVALGAWWALRRRRQK
jgi:hypothetical protein